MTESFVFTSAQAAAVKPLQECVADNNNGTFTAKFGYLNENGILITIPVGTNNKFTPLPQDRGQTTVFQTGRIRFAFKVPFDGNNLVWTLKNLNGWHNEINTPTEKSGFNYVWLISISKAQVTIG